MGQRKLSLEDEITATRAYVGNKPISEIAAELKVCPSTAWTAIHNTGIYRRKNIRSTAKKTRTAKALALFAENLTPHEIAEKLEVEYRVIVSDLRKAGVNLTEFNRIKRAKDQVRAVELRRQRMSRSDIAATLKLSVSTVDNFMREENERAEKEENTGAHAGEPDRRVMSAGARD